MVKKAILAAIFLVLLLNLRNLNSSAQTTINYYVNPQTGIDINSGTSPDSPFRTIQKAVDIAQPGSIINLEKGVYNQDLRSKRDGLPII